MGSMNWLLWIGLIVATWRATRLLVKDEWPPAKALREWVVDTFGRFTPSGDADGSWKLVGGKRLGAVGYSLAYIWTCPWCMSPWVAAALWWIAVWLGFSVPLPWLLIAVASQMTGLMMTLEERIDQRYELTKLDIDRRKEDLRDVRPGSH
jgi:hypothetical protein